MAEYKKNHFVPKSILEYWIDENTTHKGVHVFDINSQRFYVSTSLGKTPFSFAIVDDLYILTNNGNRLVGLEKWFSNQESSLSSLVRQVHNKQSLKFNDTIELSKIMMALTSLEYRSNYVLKIILELIKEDVSLRDKISANSDRPLKQLVLENIIHITSDQHIDFVPAEMIFFFAPENKDWVISDRPYFNHKDFDYRFVVLTNKVIVGYKHSLEFVYNFVDVNNEFYEILNQIIAMNAREWLVAKNKEDLKKYSSTFNTNEWKQSLKEDKVIWMPIKNLISGYTIDR
jgi:hypothetical protein